jgi:purine-nucleoside phosphorylase
LPDHDLQLALRFVRSRIRQRPEIGLVLGSGLGHFGGKIKASAAIRASDIPGYPHSSVQGHTGRLIFGNLQIHGRKSLPLLVFQGRVHYYETASLDRVIFPTLLAYELGVRNLILTNAAGGINCSFSAGDLMFIDDAFGLTFLPMAADARRFSFSPKKRSGIIDPELRRIALGCAADIGLSIRTGTYCWLKGPSYETAAEIQMLKYIGADAVGMSTVPELFVASRLGVKAIGISLISNMAAGISAAKLSHSEVTEMASQVKDKFSAFMARLILSIEGARFPMHTYRRTRS